jgi:hypothetical protein
MAIGLVALRDLPPNTSGMIRQHVEIFVTNPTTRFSEMPFAAR